MEMETKDFTRDLLDLCRLNAMKEHVIETHAVDRDTTLSAIDYKRRQLTVKLSIAVDAPPLEEGR
jgi:hypothetical protein